MALQQSFCIAFQDLKKGFLQHRVWLHLGWMEIKQRYRRSVIGPWWITLSMLIFIGMMSLVFSRLFNQSLSEYMPFFTAGFLFWTLISSSINEATELFRSNAGFIKQISLPFSLYVFKYLTRQVIYFLHNAVVYIFICLLFQFNPGWNIFFLIPGFVLFLLNVYWMCFIVALVCARFRDMVPIINSCIQVAFFVTPISWMPRLLDQHLRLLHWNPLVYLLDVVRGPLLGKAPAFSSVVVVSCFAASGILLSFWLFSRVRSRIAYWID